MLNIIVNGANGQMGQAIIRLAVKQGVNVLCGVDKMGEAEVLGFQVVRDINKAPKGADAVIDFSRPAALKEVIAYCVGNDVSLVTGTTGLTQAEQTLIDDASKSIPVFQSGNMSLGVNLQIELAKAAAATLGTGFEVEITEKHHNKKVDAPSGTALMIANAISSVFPAGRELVCGRQASDTRRRPDEIGVHSLRGGTVVGEHTIEFFGEDEVVEITHKAYSKQIFAVGALRAAEFLAGKAPGRYDMGDLVKEEK